MLRLELSIADELPQSVDPRTTTRHEASITDATQIPRWSLLVTLPHLPEISERRIRACRPSESHVTRAGRPSFPKTTMLKWAYTRAGLLQAVEYGDHR